MTTDVRGASRIGMTCAAVLLLTQACAPASVQSYGIYGTDNYFKLEWQPDERRGRPVVTGYVTNQWGISVNNVRMRVEALDTGSVVTATYIGYVFGDVTPGTRAYFEVPVAGKAANYRVSVLSYDPQHCRG